MNTLKTAAEMATEKLPKRALVDIPTVLATLGISNLAELNETNRFCEVARSLHAQGVCAEVSEAHTYLQCVVAYFSGETLLPEMVEVLVETTELGKRTRELHAKRSRAASRHAARKTLIERIFEAERALADLKQFATSAEERLSQGFQWRYTYGLGVKFEISAHSYAVFQAEKSFLEFVKQTVIPRDEAELELLRQQLQQFK